MIAICKKLSFAFVSLTLSLPVLADAITLNFKDADIHTIIETVSEATDRNFIIDPRVKGKVTVISAGAMDSDALYETFLSILEVHGFAAIPNGDVVKILPQTNAKQVGNTRGDNLVTEVIKAENIAAPQLVPILRPLLPQYGHLAAYAPSNMLIISDRASNVARIKRIIRRIDQPSDGDVEFIQLNHANATEVVRVLSSLNNKTGNSKKGANSPTFIADPRTNSILVNGDKATRLEVRAMIGHLDTPLDDDGTTKVVYLKHAKASELEKILQGYSKKKASGKTKEGSSPEQQKETSIIADENTNALIITAAPRDMKELLDVIRQLDIRRAQVLVEAIIADISLTNSKNFNVTLGGLTDAGLILGNAGTGDTATGILSALAQGVGNADPTGLVQIPSGLSLGGNVERNGQIRFLGLLQALKTNADNNILSTPTLLTMDNQEAEISIGSEVPFVTGSFSNSNGGNTVNPFQTIERKDVGTTLRITPHVVDENTVELEVFQEVSDVVLNNEAKTADVVTNKSTIKTSVIVDSGEVVALGGLIKDKSNESRTKIPLLGDIPIVGGLFRSKGSSRAKSNLMIFIRPVILKDNKDLNRYSTEKYELVRRLQEAGWGDKGPLLPESNIGTSDSIQQQGVVNQMLLQQIEQRKPEEESTMPRRYGPRSRR